MLRPTLFSLLLLIVCNSLAHAGLPFCGEITVVQRQQRADGVELTERYRERLYRTDTVIAFERLGLRAEQHEASAHAGHQHAHPGQMIRRYEKRTDGQIDYSLFDDKTRQEIQLQSREFADFGFDGDFAALHALVPATQLPQLGKQDQTLTTTHGSLRWSGKQRIALQRQQRWPTGEQTITVKPLTGCTDPRASRSGYRVIDYADTLD